MMRLISYRPETALSVTVAALNKKQAAGHKDRRLSLPKCSDLRGGSVTGT